MNEAELGVVLRGATASLDAPFLAGRALADARRRRSRRRGLVAATASSIVVGAVVLATALGGTPSAGPPITPVAPLPTATSTPVTEPSSAPPIDPTRVQPVWDPDDVADLPQVQGLLPEVLRPGGEPGPVTGSAVAAADDGGLSWVLGTSGEWTSTEYPEAGLRLVDRSVAIAPSGGEVVVTGASALWRRDVTSSQWAEVAYPSGFRTRYDASPVVAVYDDGRILLSQWNRHWLIDSDGGATRLPFDGIDEVVPAGEDVVARRFAQPLTATVEEWRDGAVVSSVDSLALQSLQRPAADAASIVFARARTGYTVPPGPTETDGLLALDREGLTTRAFLPVPSMASYYSDNGGLTPLGWLDADTVLVAVRPRSDFDTTWLVTWDVATGDLARVSSYATGLRVVIAATAL